MTKISNFKSVKFQRKTQILKTNEINQRQNQATRT